MHLRKSAPSTAPPNIPPHWDLGRRYSSSTEFSTKDSIMGILAAPPKATPPQE